MRVRGNEEPADVTLENPSGGLGEIGSGGGGTNCRWMMKNSAEMLRRWREAHAEQNAVQVEGKE